MGFLGICASDLKGKFLLLMISAHNELSKKHGEVLVEKYNTLIIMQWNV